jgi:hypothetical protein
MSFNPRNPSEVAACLRRMADHIDEGHRIIHAVRVKDLQEVVDNTTLSLHVTISPPRTQLAEVIPFPVRA